jgi:hypothetical protein
MGGRSRLTEVGLHRYKGDRNDAAAAESAVHLFFDEHQLLAAKLANGRDKAASARQLVN